MTRFFPKVNKKNFTSDSGVNYVSRVVNDELGWIFRKNNNETDFGIDGYIDVVNEEGEVTGQSFAVQIKSGESFFKNKSNNGFVYQGESKHLNYYRNQQLPLLLIIFSPREKLCLFGVFNEREIEPSGSNWKINIKSKNVFGVESKGALIESLPPLKDDVYQIKDHWAFNDELVTAGVIFYAIDRDDIVKCDTRYFLQFIDRLCVNDNLCEKIQGKLEIMVDGYNHDKRELYEVAEVRKWFNKVDETKVAWFYFCNTTPPAFGLTLYFMCISNAKVIDNRERLTGAQILDLINKNNSHPKISVKINYKLFSDALEDNWIRLNKMTVTLGLSEEINKKISKGVVEHLFPDRKNEISNIFDK